MFHSSAVQLFNEDGCCAQQLFSATLCGFWRCVVAQNLSKKFGLSILTCSPLSFDTSPLKISFEQSEGESNQILLGQAVHHHFCNDTVAMTQLQAVQGVPESSPCTCFMIGRGSECQSWTSTNEVIVVAILQTKGHHDVVIWTTHCAPTAFIWGPLSRC